MLPLLLLLPPLQLLALVLVAMDNEIGTCNPANAAREFFFVAATDHVTAVLTVMLPPRVCQILFIRKYTGINEVVHCLYVLEDAGASKADCRHHRQRRFASLPSTPSTLSSAAQLSLGDGGKDKDGGTATLGS